MAPDEGYVTAHSVVAARTLHPSATFRIASTLSHKGRGKNGASRWCLLPRGGLPLDRMNVDSAQPSYPQHIHRQRSADAVAVQRADQIVNAVDLDAVEFDHDIA